MKNNCSPKRMLLKKMAHLLLAGFSSAQMFRTRMYNKHTAIVHLTTSDNTFRTY